MENSLNTHAHVHDNFDHEEITVDKRNLILNDQERYKIKYALDQAPMGVCINLIGSGLITAWQWENIPEFILIPWLFFIACNSVAHLYIVSQYKKLISHSDPKKHWSVYNGFLFCMYSMAWGIGYHFFFQYLDQGQQLFLYYAAGIYLLSFIPALAPTYKAYMCLVISFAMPLVFLILKNTWLESLYMLTILLTTLFTLLFIAKKYQSTIVQSYSIAVDIKNKAEVNYQKQLKNFNLQFKKEADKFKNETQVILDEKEHALKTLKYIGEAIITTNSTGKITYLNPIAEIYLGWDKDLIINKNIEMVFNIYDELSKVKLSCPFEKCINSLSNVYSNNKTKLVRRDKVEYSVEYCISPIFDASSRITGTVLIFRDVTEKRNEEKTLNWQASHDQLTGLINRREFEKRLNRILNSKEQKRQHALCYIDLDHFKIVNDCCGHLAGDKLLIKIADRLKNKTRDTDTLARLGGDEFGLILYGCSQEKAKLLAEIVRGEVENIDFPWEGKTYKVSASIGVVAINNEFNNLTDILRSADMACYDAKNKGRNKVNLLNMDQEFINHNRDQTEWIDTIRECLNRESFLLYQQSILSLDEFNSNSLCELLIRAKKANGVLIYPYQFLPVAKQYNLMPVIDRWVIKACFELIAYKHPSLKNFNTLSINISEQSVCDESFLRYLISCKNDYSITANNICIEIPEISLINHHEQTVKFISDLKNNNFKLAIDNFCSGLGIFKNIKDLDIDLIKFDGRIVTDGKSKYIEYKILESMNDICHHIGSQTIAKYIDNEKNLDALYEIGIDYAQGHQFAKPIQLSKDHVQPDKAS